MAETGELVPNPRVPAHRQKAYRLRKAVDKGDEVSPEDAAFLAAYESAASNTAVGASRNSRRVMMEEESVAVGTGDAALIAASAAQAREEGKRLDTLTKTVMDMAKMTSDICRDMANTALGIMKQLSDRNEALEKAHVQMFESMRKAKIELVEAETELIEAQREADGEGGDIAGEVTKGFIQVVQNHLANSGPTPPAPKK